MEKDGGAQAGKTDSWTWTVEAKGVGWEMFPAQISLINTNTQSCYNGWEKSIPQDHLKILALWRC